MKHIVHNLKKLNTLLLLLALMGVSEMGWGQIASWPLTANGSPTGVNANITAGNFTSTGTSALTFGSSGAFASGWPTGLINLGSYFEISVAPSSGYSINLTAINFGERRSGTGIRDYQVRWSLDNFSSSTTIATVNVPDNDLERIGNITDLDINIAFGQTLKIRWYGYNAEASGGTWRINDGTLNLTGTVSAAGNTAPILSTPISTTITNSSANLGATISSNGGATITESGIVYGTNATPTGNPTITSPTATSGSFTVAVSSLDPQTFYYYRGYAVNTEGTGYSPDGTFRTLSNAPTGQASNLIGTLTSATSANLTWTAAAFPGSGATTAGYVLLRATSPNTPSLSNGNGAAPSPGANTTIVSSSIAGSATSQSSTSLAANTTYNYLLVPFCWDGTNAATYNYLTALAPTASVSTPSALSDVVAVASSESATISSLINDDAPLTSATGAQVWQITVRDGGAAMNDADILPTIVTGFTLTQNSGNAIDNWLDAIKTIALFDGTTWIANSSSITATTIVFSGLSVTVADNTSKTLTLRLSLNPTLNNIGSGNLDGDDFVFNLTSGNFITASDGSSSTNSSFTTASSTNGQNVLDIIATKLEFFQQPTNVVTLTNITPAVTVQATDIGGNRDRDFVSSISIIATGATLTGSPVSTNAVLGIATFSTLQFSTIGSGVTLNASSTVTGITSVPFNVTLGMGSYVYRSLRSGNWNSISSGNETWERSTDGDNWSTVTSSGDLPNSSAGTITVLAGHTITVSSSTNADDLTIETNGQITIAASQTFTISDGTGTDATINGTLKNFGTLTNNGQINFGNGSLYDHAINGGVIPTATWDPNSTIEVSGVVSTIPTFSPAVTYGNVTWKCASQSGTLNLVGNLRNVAGNLTISNTNSNILRLTGGTGYTFMIGGNIVINSASANLEIANGTSTGNVLNIGGWNQTAGSFNPNIGTSTTVAINFTGNNGTFTFSAGTLTNTYINWTINSSKSLTLNNNIPIAASRNLTVNGTLNCGVSSFVSGAGVFNLASGGSLITSNINGINGSISTSGTKTLSTGANYEFNATGAQVTGALLPATVNNLTVSGTSDLTLSNAGQLTVSGNLGIGSTAKLTIGTAQSVTVAGALSNGDASRLVIKSDASGTGSLIHNTDGVGATVERYITAANWATAGSGWHLLSSPVATQSISGAWTPTGTGNDYDFYAYDETANTNNWLNQKVGANNINTFIPGKGYLVAYQQNGTKTFNGNLNAANVTLSGLTNTSGSAYPGWHLVGNPFASAINWSAGDWTKTNITATAQVWNSASGSYQTTTEVSGIIPAMNGFMIYTTGNGQLTIPTNSRVHNAANWYKSDEEFILLKANDLEGQTSQSSIIRFNPASTEVYDVDFDSYFLAGFAPMFYSVSGSSLYALNTLPAISNDLVIPLGFVKNTATNFNIELAKNISGAIVYLTDKKTNKVTNLNNNPVYAFTASDGDDANRFFLHFASVGLGETPATQPVLAYYHDGALYVNNTEAGAEIMLFGISGQLLKQQTATDGLNTMQAGKLSAGVYVVRVQSAAGTYSSKVIVTR